MLEELLKELNKYYHISADPRFRGEHPRCDELLDEILIEFRKMKKEDAIKLVSSMNDDQLEQVTYVLEESLDLFPELSEYVRCIM